LVGQPEGKSSPRRSVCRKVDNIKMDLREMGQKGGLDSSGSGQGSMICCCERGNELLSFIKSWKFLEQLSNCWLLKKDSVPWS
jgi:hypothetical protein